MNSCAEVLTRLLAQRGVDLVFGIPGNHTVALYRGFETAGIRHVTSRHEQGAAFMADGYARASGRPGVCILISGPGLLNAATAIAQAYADSVPMLVITGVAARSNLGMKRGTLHELPDQQATASTFCRASCTLLAQENLPVLLDEAFGIFSASRPGPVHIEIPLDLMDAPFEQAIPIRSSAPGSPAADPDMIAAAADLLGNAKLPMLLVGGGAINASPEVVAIAERLDAPVVNTVNGKGICPSTHPLSTGGSPSLGCVRAALKASDVVLAIGTELGETDYNLLLEGGEEGEEGEGGLSTDTWIRIDIDPGALIRPAPAAIAITADAGIAASQLLEALGLPKPGASVPSAASPQPGSPRDLPPPVGPGSTRAASVRQAIQTHPHFHAEIQAFFRAIELAAPEAIVVGDSTRPTYYAAWQYETNAPRRYFHSVSGFGTLGYALPAAIGARFATADPVICLIGDGGIQFTSSELLTGVQARLPLPVIVWNNHGYAEIENSMNARNVPADSTRILTPDFAALADAHRCGYGNPTDPASLTQTLTTALEDDRPTLIEVLESDFVTTPSGQWYR